MQAVILISARRALGAEGCDRYRRSYDGYVPLHKLNSNFLYVRGWLVPLGPRGGGFRRMCTPRFSTTPPGFDAESFVWRGLLLLLLLL